MNTDNSSSKSHPSPNQIQNEPFQGSFLERRAVGKRFLEKRICEKCLGKSHHEHKSEIRCEQCSGSGWEITPDRQPQICSSCEGFKVTISTKKESCHNCSGRGYHVAIIQNFEYLLECGKCQGEKRVSCDCTETDEAVYPCENCDERGWVNCYLCEGTGDAEIKCSICNGSGTIAAYDCSLCDGLGHCVKCGGSGIDQELSEIMWYRDWIKSSLLYDLTKSFGENFLLDMDDSEKIVIPDGRLLRPKKCGSCLGKGCSICNNNKIIGVIIEAQCSLCQGGARCNRCEGSGELTECIECDGDGSTVGCPECDGDGFYDCDACNGLGCSMCQKCYGNDELAGTLLCPLCHGSGTQTIIAPEKCV